MILYSKNEQCLEILSFLNKIIICSPEPLSSDPEENWKPENEILKLQAQYDYAFQMRRLGDLPSKIESEFLKNIKIRLGDRIN